MALFSAKQTARSAAVNVLTMIILVGSALTAPGTVLCLGPGHHCHLEAAAGAICNNDLPGTHGLTPRPRDGCPKGSRDFRLSVDSHRTDTMGVIAVAAAALFIAPYPAETLSPRELLSRGFSAARQPHSAIVLLI